jgi:hypothetical protein
MQGIQFVTNTRGKWVAMQIDLKRYAAVWEDFEDVLVANSRRRENSVSLDKVRASLNRQGRLRG